MVLARWQATVTDEAGNILPGAQVEVRREVTGAPLATLYSDRAGTTPMGNPFSVDPEGFAAFHVVGGAYRITATYGDFTRIWRYVAVGLAAETDGVALGVPFLFDDGTADADPGSGAFRLNNATPASATEIYISDASADALDVAGWLASFDDAGDVGDRGTITIQAVDASALLIARVTGSVVDGGAYSKVSVTILSASGTFTDGIRFGVAFGVNGADGAVSGPGPVTLAGQFAVFADATGDNLAGGTVGGSPSTPLSIASDADVQASTEGKVIHAGHLQSANVYEALSDGATVAVDWSLAMHFTLTIAGNRIIGNPTNGIPGQYRTILVQGDSGTDRTITFDTQILGDVPTITDCDSTRWYKLYLECITPTHFAVSAKRVLGT